MTTATQEPTAAVEATVPEPKSLILFAGSEDYPEGMTFPEDSAADLIKVGVSFGERITDDVIGQAVAAYLLNRDFGYRVTKPAKGKERDKDGTLYLNIPDALGMTDATASRRVTLGRYVVQMADAGTLTLEAARAAAGFVQTVGDAPKRSALLIKATGKDTVKEITGEDLAKVLPTLDKETKEARSEQRQGAARLARSGQAGPVVVTEATDAAWLIANGPRMLRITAEHLTGSEEAVDMLTNVSAHFAALLVSLSAEVDATLAAPEPVKPVRQSRTKVSA